MILTRLLGMTFAVPGALLAISMIAGAQSHVRGPFSEGPHEDSEKQQAGDWSFGRRIARLGDVSGDLIPDLAISHSENEESTGQGCVWIVSGASGKLVHKLSALPGYEGFADSIATAAFTSKEIRQDLLVLARTGGPQGCRVALLYRGAGDAWGIEYAQELDGIDADSEVRMSGGSDIDGDGIHDYILGIPGTISNSAYPGEVILLSGAHGATLRRSRGRMGDRLGMCVADVGDIDGDGVSDYAASSNRSRNPAYVAVFSGESGEEILRFSPEAAAFGVSERRFGESIIGVGDHDGDGRPDVAVSSYQDCDEFDAAVRIFSGGSRDVMWMVRRAGVGFGRDMLFLPPGVIAVGADALGLLSRGGVECYSLGSRELLYTSVAPDAFDYGAVLELVGDANQDGVIDYAAGTDGVFSKEPGLVVLVSGADGSRLWAAYPSQLRGGP